MRTHLIVAMVVGICLNAAVPALAGGIEAQQAFERLKALAGTWSGPVEGEGAAEEGEQAVEAVHEFRVASAGSVVMEIMGPGSEHEMINMYHLDGEDLVLTHYCAGGNQPTMRLDREASSAERLEFDFTGGTNLDPAVDAHIHAAEITLVDDNHLDSVWTSYAGGEQAGVIAFHLARAE